MIKMFRIEQLKKFWTFITINRLKPLGLWSYTNHYVFEQLLHAV
jgi:hypothetical protein